ncbi:hypothetical protein [Paenibacillus sp. GCM10027626]|uniref:hypothetical protein n=1 Tax=Paenibacillus sp. GCM10027626 TaxID=3273411 RepID=UPI0036332110
MKPKLLLVEDEPGMLEEMQTYLQREGFRVLTACTGKEALVKYEAEENGLEIRLYTISRPVTVMAEARRHAGFH